MNTLRTNETCTAGMACMRQTNDAVMCGYPPSLLPELPLAEELCPEVLWSAIDAQERLVFGPKKLHFESDRNFRLGCLYLELALNKHTPPDVAEEHFESTGIYFADGLKVTKKHDQFAFNIGHVAASMPLFRLRKLGVGNIDTFSAIQQTRHNLARLADTIDKQPAERRRNTISRLGTSLALLRKGIAVYGSTYREERKGEANIKMIKGASHSSYLINDRKIPLNPLHAYQSRRTSIHTVSIVFSEIVREQYAKAGINTLVDSLGDTPSPGALTRRVMDLLLAEIRVPQDEEAVTPDGFPYSTHPLLDGVSDAIYERIKDKLQIQAKLAAATNSD